MGYAQLQVKYFEDLIKFIFNLNRDIKWGYIFQVVKLIKVAVKNKLKWQ